MLGKFLKEVILAATLSLTVTAAAGGESEYLLKAPLPVPGAMTYSPVAGGFNGAPVFAYDVSDTPVFKTDSVSVGMIASEAVNSTVVGAFIAPPAGMAVDWSKTVAAFAESEAATNGFAFYTALSDPGERFVASQCGEFAIRWFATDGTVNEVAYQANAPATVVPHRLYWTSGGYNGPGVSIPKNYGVRLYGRKDLFWDESRTNAQGVAVYDFGVHYDKDNGTMSAYATGGVGPEGHFVVAYYDSGLCERLIGYTVVEVARPDAIYLRVTVGAEVRPQNENYDPDSGLYLPVIRSQQSGASGGDPREPYFLYQQVQAGQYHKKENRVFAISETMADEKDPRMAEIGAKKAEICWEAADDFDVYWPFEMTCYYITWPAGCPTVVVGGGAELGPGVSVPEDYSASLLDWKVPSDVAVVPSVGNAVTVRKAGRFCLKLENAARDDFWLVPLKGALSTDADAFPTSQPQAWPLGSEVLPQEVVARAAGGLAAELVRTVDRDAPGYIYETGSPGHNWNRHLYHAEGASEKASSGDAAYAGLVSTIHFVDKADASLATDVEVWWQRSYRTGDMPAPIAFPVLPQRYKAVWPDGDSVQDIVIASGRGSGTGGRRTDGRSLFLLSQNARGTLDYALPVGESGAQTVGFWFNPRPTVDSAAGVTATTGRVVSVTVSESASLELRVLSVGDRESYCQLACGQDVLTNFSAKICAWMPVYVRFAGGRASVSFGGAFADVGSGESFRPSEAGEFRITVGDASGGAASGVSVDGFMVWNLALADDFPLVAATNAMRSVCDLASVKVEFATATKSVDGIVYAQDEHSYRYFTGTDLAPVTPGYPRWDDGLFAVSDGVTPRAYYENDAGVWGYNPNEEHAIALQAADGRYALYALRNDMNDAAHRPYVFMEYAENGRGAMRAFRVLVESEHYPWPTLQTTAGTTIQTISPLDRMPSGTCPKCHLEKTDDGRGPVTYRDRTGVYWARRAGTFDHYDYYYGEDGFICTADGDGSLSGEMIPFINRNDAYDWANDCARGAKRKDFTRERLCALTPSPIPQKSVWPDDAPTMSIAQVLTTAEYGLPEIYSWKTAAVAYPTCITEADKAARIVKLIDPTVAQTADFPLDGDFPGEYGFKTGPSGDCFLKQGKYYFVGLPPVVSDRLYVDVNAAGAGKAQLTLVGDLHESAAGASYLRVNSLSSDDFGSVANFFRKKGTEAREGTRGADGADKLVEALTKIFDAGDREPSPHVEENASSLVVSYRQKDHYALVATGEGHGYVTLVENDGAEAEGLPVSMKVINVGTNLYCGQVIALTDPNNTLSEQLNVLYTAPLGRCADNFTFDWYSAEAPSDGHEPTVPSASTENPSASYPGGDGAWSRDTVRSGDGKSCIEAVNSAVTSLNEMGNRYWTMHYKAKEGTPAYAITRGRWSVWCEPTLAEGWVQRVLNAVTPFAQRTSEFYNSEADTSMTMLSQIGAPWQGDVALNNENLASVGLMELYRTVLNKAESMSIARAGATPDKITAAANEQLILAASRLADFNLLLGAEAYADAKNPVIGSTDGTTFAGSVFAFANQVDSLLDEELALLRGRTSATSPNTWTHPCYNRLVWNYTKGMTQGELAYVNNYNVLARNGLDTADTAAAQYPQGHGDAYGYYLSAVTEFYRLLRNPAFTWGEASMMGMLIADKVVNVDYEEEDKFAEAAYRLAKTGADVVDLTARKQWKDAAGDVRSGYFDDRDVENKAGIAQAFGYGETACRAGFGALCNWAVANTLLPTSATNAVRHFADASIGCVTRQNCSSLAPLADAVAALESKLEAVDAGLNPLGLSENAIPFDISPQAFVNANGQSGVTHYEQIRTRAVRALENCEAALGYAQKCGSQIAAIQAQEGSLTDATADMEREYNKQLIAIYGRPYADDIGAGKLYEQGYDGPDLYHYAYIDLSAYGLDAISADEIDCTLRFVSCDFDSAEPPTSIDGNAVQTSVLGEVKLTLTADGLIAKPAGYTGTRASEGTLQAAYRDFVTAYVKAKNVRARYENALGDFDWCLQTVQTTLGKDSTAYRIAKRAYQTISRANSSKLTADILALCFSEASDAISAAWSYLSADVEGIVGTAISAGDVAKEVAGGIATAMDQIAKTSAFLASIESAKAEGQASLAEVEVSLAELELDYYSNRKDQIDALLGAGSDVCNAARTCQDAHAELLAAQQAYRTKLEEGGQLLAARELARRRAASEAVTARYRDMFARVERNNALSKYSTTFDIAQRYVFELAKVYDYETGLLTSDPSAGGAFLGAVVGTRALGAKNLPGDSSVTDDGLWGAIARMDANWNVLEGRLGANNPLYEQKWHSLRYSNFRIDPAATSDAAWRDELAKHWVDDVFAVAGVARHCQPPAGASGKVAGLVIPFATSISAGENLFGKTLMGGEEQYAPSAYATRIMAAGVELVGYGSLVVSGVEGLAANPQVYLVPTGKDYMRTPAGTKRDIVSFSVVDQVLPLPYAIGSTELDDTDWIATLSGLDGTADSMATIRRHAQFPANGDLGTSQRLIGRSVWNDGWLLVIPANAMNGNVETAKKRFLSGAVTDIRIGFSTNTRQGN